MDRMPAATAEPRAIWADQLEIGMEFAYPATPEQRYRVTGVRRDDAWVYVIGIHTDRLGGPWGGRFNKNQPLFVWDAAP